MCTVRTQFGVVSLDNCLTCPQCLVPCPRNKFGPECPCHLTDVRTPEEPPYTYCLKWFLFDCLKSQPMCIILYIYIYIHVYTYILIIYIYIYIYTLFEEPPYTCCLKYEVKFLLDYRAAVVDEDPHPCQRTYVYIYIYIHNFVQSREVTASAARLPCMPPWILPGAPLSIYLSIYLSLSLSIYIYI